jgi:hypothetical protein
MSDRYEEDEKCRLKELTINPSNALAFPVKKGSPLKEHITQKYVCNIFWFFYLMQHLSYMRMYHANRS